MTRVFWYYRQSNDSPLITAAYLARERAVQLPGQYAREHQNTVMDAADSFASVADVDAAMGTGWTEQPLGRPGQTYSIYVDLGSVHDPTVFAAGHEEEGLIYIDAILTFQGSRELPVLMPVIQQAVLDLARRFPPKVPNGIRIESWQGIQVVQQLTGLGLPVTLFTPTAKSNAEEWPILAQRLSSRTLVLPPHARLREELLNLTYEVGPSGIRVIDKGRIHQDHAVAIRGVVAGLTGPVLAPWTFRSGGMTLSLAPVLEPVSEAVTSALDRVTTTLGTAANALTRAFTSPPARPVPAPMRKRSFEEMECLQRSDLTEDERERFDKEYARRWARRRPGPLDAHIRKYGVYWPSDGQMPASGSLADVMEAVRQKFAMWR